MHQVIHLPLPTESAARLGGEAACNPIIRTDAVYVVFTSIDETLSALRLARHLTTAMALPLILIHFRAVPYRLSVDAAPGISPLETDDFIGRLRKQGVDVRVRVYLCRTERHTIPLAIKPHSLIVLAGRRSWWPTQSERWRRMLEGAGHFVVFVDELQHRRQSMCDGT